MLYIWYFNNCFIINAYKMSLRVDAFKIPIWTYCMMFWIPLTHAQELYKTPSGQKYHLASCRMVENVSMKLLTSEAIKEFGLEPCKICKPPLLAGSKTPLTLGSSNKAVGVANTVQCKGITKKGTRCLHRTSIANGYCFQHVK